MTIAIRRAISFAAAATLIVFAGMVAAGCGRGDTDGHGAEARDDHARETHTADAHEGDDHEGDDHEGHDHGTDDHETPDLAADDHEGHDHGDAGHAEGPALTERDRHDAGIALAVAGPGHLEIHSRLLGEVRMNQERQAHVVPPVAGVIREVRVRIGDEVTAGQILAVLASRELAEARAAYLGSRGRRELAQIEHDREKELWERNILAEQDYLNAKQALLEADIELQTAEQALHALGTSEKELGLLEESHEAGALTRLELRAPLSGTVTELHMVMGEVVREDSDVLVVADLSTVWVDLDVPQNELHAVRKGQKVTISASGIDIPDASGVVSFVSPVVDDVTRTALARIEITNNSGEWRPGLFVTAYVASDHIEVPVLIAKDAVQSLDGEQVVFVPDGDAFSTVPVAVGRSNATHVELVSGLEQGHQYVSEGAFALKAEMVTSGMDSHAGHGH